MAKKEKKILDKQGWVQSFMLIGHPVISEYTYKIDQQAKSSDWIYNTLSLNVDCGEEFGVIQCEMNGGYGAGRENVCYVHGKKEDGKDDFENRYQIDWDDRMDEDILKGVGDLCFIKIGLEKDTKGNVVESRFLNAYDAINHIAEMLTEDMLIRVHGQLEYHEYQGVVQLRKKINKIVLENDTAQPTAQFTQTMLIDKYSVGKPDKEKQTIPIIGYILEKCKEYRGIDLTDDQNRGGKYVPLRREFEYEYDTEDIERTKKKINVLFKVKKGYTMITYKGVFVEGGALITTTYADLADDVKELVDCGAMELEEALADCTENKSKVRRMILKKPVIKMVGEEGSKVSQIQKFENKYSEEDLILDYLIQPEEKNDEDDEVPFNEVDSNDMDDDSWLDQLGE